MLANAVPLVALAVLLAVAYAHPPWWVEAGAAVVASIATLATSALDGHGARVEIQRLGPVVAFLVAILVVADSCRANGVFDAVGARLRRLSGGGRLLLVTFVVATAVTVVLSLDATVVLLTPVVLAATASRFLPGELACVRLANSASLLIPVANLTNLLAVPSLHLTFAHFAAIMVVPWLAVLVTEYGALRVVAARHPLEAPTEPEDEDVDRLPRFPVVVVLVMLAGFAVGSPYGVAPAWIAGAAAVLLVVHDLLRGRTTPPRVLRSANLSFAIFVLGLGLVVAGLGNGWFGDRLADVIPHRTDLLGLLVVAAIGALLANLVNNLPATLLLVPLVAPLGTTPLLALLIGVNVGSSLTWTGSLANLLWRRVLIAQDRVPPSKLFHLTSLVTCPIAIVAGVVVLDGWTRLVG